MAGKSYLRDVPIANFCSHLKVGFSSMVHSAAASPTPASVTPSASAPAANKLSLFPTSSTPQIAPAVQASSFGPPTTQPPTTTTAPTTASTPSIPNFFTKPVPPSTPAPATTTPPTVPSFSFGPAPAQTLKPTPFPFAKPSILLSLATTSTSAQANPPSIFGATSSTVNTPSIFGAPSSAAAPASAPSAPTPLKFDFGKKPASTTSKLMLWWAITRITLAPTDCILPHLRHPAMLGTAVYTIKYLVESCGWSGITLPAVHARHSTMVRHQTQLFNRVGGNLMAMPNKFRYYNVPTQAATSSNGGSAVTESLPLRPSESLSPPSPSLVPPPSPLSAGASSRDRATEVFDDFMHWLKQNDSSNR
ncbi:hypothetical protein EDB19DRAFT_1941414 [Suillus lakei]|nr:hypothetical protein EDB19DRAFT_1941414 [Suillus lakei]